MEIIIINANDFPAHGHVSDVGFGLISAGYYPSTPPALPRSTETVYECEANDVFVGGELTFELHSS